MLCLFTVELVSREVYVSAVSVLADPRSSLAVAWQESNNAKPCLTVATLVFSAVPGSTPTGALIAQQRRTSTKSAEHCVKRRRH
jgi:hypothetical protein